MSGQTQEAEYWVEVEGRAYGPYTAARLQDFVREGRVRPTTPVSTSPHGPWTPAADLARTPRAEGLKVEATETDSNFVIFAELRGAGADGLREALSALGRWVEVAPELFILRAQASASRVRNTLSMRLDRNDRLLVVDATADRFAAHNVGMSAETKIRQIWATHAGAAADRVGDKSRA